ncbi:MAG: tRNA uridine-5-carboxymethylaminomethyl(34) synthesis GTPase MnmE [Nitrospirae bacterium]|nr:tRNA uridine-5-carboxymethylaminomethyl(34) synthesis GTPase MnmE [Nitrospirota bacterium]
MNNSDTITAISTPVGEAGIGIVRMSGRNAIQIADTLFSSRKFESLHEVESHRVLYGVIKDPETNETVDEVLITVMRQPRTYTKEDIVEINCHGGFIPLRRALELTLKQGARLAEPGEFTKRAFLNGRLDLTQAEAVIDLIRAKTDIAEGIAIKQLKGSIKNKIEPLRESLLNICAHIEAYIDFPEEEIEPSSVSEIKTQIKGVIDTLRELSASYEEGRLFRDGISVAIVGKPNVGKSSILNALLQKDRAIVTEEVGTTRDVIEDYINVNGLPVKVMDTAGIKEAHNMAEKEAIKRSLQALESSDIVIAVIDGSQALKVEDFEVIEKAMRKNSIVVINKSDLPHADLGFPNGTPFLRLSAKTGDGMGKLKEAIFGSVMGNGVRGSNKGGVRDTLVTNIRHKGQIDTSIKWLNATVNAIEKNEPLEIVEMELREAVKSLSELTGKLTREDILHRIFSSFCIGK